MTIEYLKKAPPRLESIDTATTETVERLLSDIQRNGRSAVEKYARDLDGWHGPIVLGEDDFAKASSSLSQGVKDDITFAHARVRDFAQRQRESLHEFEVELINGLVAGQKLIPVNTAGCYIPGGRYAHAASAIMSVCTAKVAGVPNIVATSSEPIKSLATRLQRLLASRGVAIKRTHALDAVARLLGHQSWVSVPKKASPAPLHLVSAFRDLNRPLYSWKEAIECFCDWCEGDVIGGGMHVYQIGFGKSSVTFDSPFTSSTGRDGKVAHQLEIWWHTESTGQLAAAISGIETMRRRYEETGKGIVDGLAAAQYCLRTPHSDAQPDDPINSELVVVEVTPGPSYGDEVARGDEVKCWSELEKVHPKESSPTYSLDEGRWAIGKCMYEWQLSTVRVQGPVSSVLTRSLTTAESGTLFRRHQQAVRSGLYFCREDKDVPQKEFARAAWLRR